MEYAVKSITGKTVSLHYWKNQQTGTLSNFKFKNDPVFNLFGE